MKFFVSYYASGNNKHVGWSIVEFAFRRDITKESIVKQINNDTTISGDKILISNIVKL